MLAHMSDERVEEILNTHGLRKLSENTVSVRTAFEAELAEVREDGVAYNWAERIEGVFSVGVLICSRDRIYGGLSVTGPTRRMTEERVDDLSRTLLGLAEEIELKIEYSEI